MPVAVAHENGAVRRERTARDECSGKRRGRDRITVARSTARHNAAHAYAAEAIRCAALGRAELPFCIRESGRWASLTLHVRLPSPHLVTGLRSTAQIGTRAYGALWCARVLRHRACEFVRNDDRYLRPHVTHHVRGPGAPPRPRRVGVPVPGGAPPTATPDDARVAQRTHITQGKVLKHYYCMYVGTLSDVHAGFLFLGNLNS